MHNQATLIGNLGRDPELTHSKGGMPICRLSVATTHRKKVGDNWEDHTEWHRVTAFGKTAEHCANYLRKGRQVHIIGRIETSTYEKDGEKRYSTGIIADRVNFLGKKDAETAGASGGGPGGAPAPYSPPTWR